MKFNLEKEKERILRTVSLLLPDVNRSSLETRFDVFSKGFGGIATDEQVYDKFIFDTLYESGKLHIVDWKWALEDILSCLSEIQEVVSHEVVEEDHDEETGAVSGTIKINGKEYSFEKLYQEGFTDEVNEALDSQGIDQRLYIVDQNRGDNFEFILVSKDSYDSLTCNDFLPFGSC